MDVTEQPGYYFGASGGLVSTPRDPNAFWDGLLGGQLLPARALRLMTHDTSDVGGLDVYPRGSRYGYGLASFPLSCGGVYWGHGGRSAGQLGGGRPGERGPGHRHGPHDDVDGGGPPAAPGAGGGGGRGPVRGTPLAIPLAL